MAFCEVLSEYAVFHMLLPWLFVRCYHNLQYFMRCFHGHVSMNFCEVLQNMQYFMRCFHGHVSMDFCEVLSQYAVVHEMFPWTCLHGLL